MGARMSSSAWHTSIGSTVHSFIYSSHSFLSFLHLFSPISTVSIRWDLIPQHLTWIPQVKSTLLSIGLSSGKERERVRARSVQNVKEGALGWIPKSYPLCFSVDGGKKSRTTINAEQTHRSRWAQRPRDGRQGSASRGQGWRVLGGDRGCGGIAGHEICCSSVHVCCSGCYSGTVDVQRLAVLLRSMEHAEVHFLSAFASVHRARTHSRARTHTGQGTHDHMFIPNCVMMRWKQPELDNHTTHMYLDDPVYIHK